MEKENTKEEIKQMEIGQMVSFPIERLAVIRTYASELSLVMDRKYKTRADKGKRRIEVSRIA